MSVKEPAARHIHHYHRHVSYSYPAKSWLRIYALFLAPLLIVLVSYWLVRLFGIHQSLGPISWLTLFTDVGHTLLRLLVAYVLALLLSVPLALLIDKNQLTERILLPVFDVIQSIPVLAFFPVVIIYFVHFNALDSAAIFIIFLSMLWNIVFSLVGGIRLIPTDIKSAAKIFKIKDLFYLRKVLIPAIFPYITTGSLLAWAQGWNIIIVAEVLHTYVPGGGSNLDLPGIGSTLVHASALGDSNLFIAAILVMVAVIAVMNFLLWQKLLQYAERFRFE